MKKLLLLLFLILLSALLGYSLSIPKKQTPLESAKIKKPILRLALVSDSHGDDELLARALREAQGRGVNLVVGLGDWTKIGTLEELRSAKTVFDQSKLPYIVTAGDHDLWDSRNRVDDPLANFRDVFGSPIHEIERNGVQIVILDNSDIYKGIVPETWEFLNKSLQKCPRGPVASFPPAPSINSGQAVLRVYPERSRRAVGSPATGTTPRLCFVFAHKTPFHPESEHIMGEDSPQVAKQAEKLLSVIEESGVDGFFSGDLHFFAEFKSPRDAVKITTVGAVTRERNFQGPRFAIVTVLADYSWEVEDVEIR